MTKTLFVPDHIMRQQRAKKKAEEEAKQKPLAERIPQPTGRYSGSRFNIEGGEVRIINDDEVIATIVDPDDIKTYGA